MSTFKSLCTAQPCFQFCKVATRNIAAKYSLRCYHERTVTLTMDNANMLMINGLKNMSHDFSLACKHMLRALNTKHSWGLCECHFYWRYLFINLKNGKGSSYFIHTLIYPPGTMDVCPKLGQSTKKPRR